MKVDAIAVALYTLVITYLIILVYQYLFMFKSSHLNTTKIFGKNIIREMTTFFSPAVSLYNKRFLRKEI